MEGAVMVFSCIKNAIARNNIDLVADIAQILTAIAAVLIALFALRGERKYRSTESLMDLVKYFDDNCFFVRMWRLDQLTRKSKLIEAIPINDLLNHKNPEANKLIKEAFAEDWETYRADMFSVYFFALRVNAWFETSKGFSSSRKISLLNETFGHQLVLTFQNHHLVACRINKQKDPNYYPAQYGLYNPTYKKLLKLLEDDLLRSTRIIIDQERKNDIEKNREAINNHLRNIPKPN
ncbi:MAG: hypothetical protein V1715_12545 [bacterium]